LGCNLLQHLEVHGAMHLILELDREVVERAEGRLIEGVCIEECKNKLNTKPIFKHH
jgi:NADH:ubiquinone oxidoreductase subunit D